MNKSFFEQLLFVSGSLLTCVFILATSRMDLQNLDSKHLETRLTGLSQSMTQSIIGNAESFRDLALSEAAGRLPNKWVSFLNSSYLAELRDQVGSNAAEPLVGALPIQTAACSTQELRHILQGEMSPMSTAASLTIHQSLMDDTRPTIEQVQLAERELRLDQFRVRAILDSVYNFTAHVQILASQIAPATDGLKAVVVVEHKCRPVDDPSTLLPIDPTKDMTVDPASQEATLESFSRGFDRNDAPVSRFQNVALMAIKY